MKISFPWGTEEGFLAEAFDYLMPYLDDEQQDWLANSDSMYECPDLRIITALSNAIAAGATLPKEWRPKLIAEIDQWAEFYGGTVESFLDLFERDGLYV